jgi:uncharacterized membrane protein
MADARERSEHGIQIKRHVIVQKAPPTLFAFWRNFENLPRFMGRLDSVRMADDKASHWVVKGPAGARVEWDARIINERENELISWESVGESDVRHAGSVQFRPLAGERGTDVTVTLRYQPPAGRLGATVAKLLGDDPSEQIAEDLNRFKRLMETGQAPRRKPEPPAAPEGAMDLF